MTTLPNGKPIDMEMLEVAMEDSNLTQRALARRKLRRFNGGSEACPGFSPCIA